jgi:hypothetical protein
VKIFQELGEMVAELPCRLMAVQVDKLSLTEYIDTDGLYRLAFWRLLEEINNTLITQKDIGMVMIDMRSDLHSSIQDRRMLDAYREWLAGKHGDSHIIELPWFGFSSFYSGLQIADFISYLVDFAANERPRESRDNQLIAVVNLFRKKLRFIELP